MEAVFNLYFDDEGCGGRASHMLRRRANIVSCHVANCISVFEAFYGVGPSSTTMEPVFPTWRRIAHL